MKAARGAAFAAMLAIELLAARALGNGKFPASGQIVVDPADAQRVLVRTTFGILVSTDGSLGFDWICETGAGYGGGYDPGIAVALSGAIIAGVPTGVSRGTQGGCAWAHAQGGLDQTFVIDVSVRPGHPETAVALSKGNGTADSVWISADGGASWAKAGVDLPSDFGGSTLDIAPSDPQRIYVGGTHKLDGGYRGAVARSKDGGGTWEVLDLSSLFGSATPYLGAVDPSDASRLYVRLDNTPGRLLQSVDGGESWTTLLTIPGFLKAFALSPDGGAVLAGGPTDGLWRAKTADLSFKKVSSMAATCLSWAGDRVYACSDQVLVSLSTDMGSSFTSLLPLQCVRGPLSCDPATSVGAVCPAMWGPIAQQIGAMYCAPPSVGDAGVDAGPDASTEGDAGMSSGGGGHTAPSGCGCHAGQSDVGGGGLWMLVTTVLLLRRTNRQGAKDAKDFKDLIFFVLGVLGVLAVKYDDSPVGPDH